MTTTEPPTEQMCRCGHIDVMHYAHYGQCLASTPDKTWACYCTEYNPTPNPFADVDSPLELLGLLAGAASLCWDPPPTGVFDAEQATQFVDAAMERLIELGWA